MMRRHPFASALAALGLFAAPLAAHAATITIVNVDGVGEGFNDPAPRAPIGGNPGVTLGAQRLNVFQHAAGIWGAILPSNVTIQVRAQFNAQTCGATSAVLGSAGPRSAHANFANAPVADTWYHQALANRLADADLSGLEDINATFNSNLDDSPTCLGGVGWYYGFDGNEGAAVDLLPVVLHELGHGLGFSTLVATSTGALFNGLPDIYARHLLDLTTGLHWDEMSNAQRQASAINTGNLVWDGASANVFGQLTLQKRPRLAIGAPGSIAGDYAINTASFGAPVTSTPTVGDVVLVVDPGGASVNDGCETPFVNAGQLAGKVALIDRGNCTFTMKAANAQAAGAIAVIVANNVASAAPPGMSGSDPSITIPVVSVTQDVGNLIKSELSLANTVTVSIGLDPKHFAGMSDDNQMLLYAPNPLESGSSVSHWDVSMTPNLLMEPAINDDLGAGVDLTRHMFEDIGWMAFTTGVEAPVAADGLTLRRAVPNPFDRATLVHFALPAAGRATVEVFDLGGRRVRRILEDELAAGEHTARWDGADANGQRLPAGIYRVRVRAAGETRSQSLVLLD